MRRDFVFCMIFAVLPVLFFLSSVCAFAVDTTPPTQCQVGSHFCRVSTDGLRATFESYDGESGIAGYEYAVGTTPGGTDALGWTWTSAAEVIVDASDLDHVSKYYFVARAQNGAGLWGPYGYSLGTYVALPLDRIADAKALPDGTCVYLTHKLVTAQLDDFLDGSAAWYIQEDDRTCGIGVTASGIGAGRYAGLTGRMTTVGQERVIRNYSFGPSGGTDALKPLAMLSKDLGGVASNGAEGQVPGARGPSNVGLLVKVAGKVTAREGADFYIDDGSNLNEGAKPGLLVKLCSLPHARVLAAPVNSYVQVTGVSCLSTFGGVPIRALRPGKQQDILPLVAPVAYVYKTDLTAANSFKNMLDAERMPTDLISIGDAETADLSKYSLIIIGYDTGDAGGWGNPATVANVIGAGRSVLGVESGGLAFFEQVGGLHFTKSAASFRQGGVLKPATESGVFVNRLYKQPYEVTTSYITTITVSNHSESTYGYVPLSTAPTGVATLGFEADNMANCIVGWESPRYMYWGFRDRPDLLTDDGKHLLVNAAWYAMQH